MYSILYPGGKIIHTLRKSPYTAVTYAMQLGPVIGAKLMYNGAIVGVIDQNYNVVRVNDEQAANSSTTR